MSDVVKIAAMLALAVVAATGLYIYFSPYQSCVRAMLKDSDRSKAAPDADALAALQCAKLLGGH